MATKKDLEFVDYVFAQTKEGTISWEPTADEDKFVSSVKGKYKVTLARGFDREDEQYYFWLGLSDESGRELLKIYSLESPVLEIMFTLVRRDALNVDKALDEIMGGSGAGNVKDIFEAEYDEPEDPFAK
jgi:hypothetical protein